MKEKERSNMKTSGLSKTPFHRQNYKLYNMKETWMYESRGCVKLVRNCMNQ